MATGADVLGAVRQTAGVTWRDLVADFCRLIGLAFVLSLAVGIVLTAAAVALPAPLACEEGRCAAHQGPGSGTFFMRRAADSSSVAITEAAPAATSDPWTAAPLLDTQVDVRVAGLLARARVVQRFRNGTDEWVEGVYVFPLPAGCAVDHLRMRAGERVVEGEIRERGAARAAYVQAKESGRRASLVEQERPNVFTTSVANLGPGQELAVEIEMQQMLEIEKGEVRLRFPLVVGPRYVPGSERLAAFSGIGWSPDDDAARVTPPVTPPGAARRQQVSLDVELDAGFPVEAVESRYHAVVVERKGDGRFDVRLRDAVVPADRDYELVWKPRPGTMPNAAVFVETRGGSTFALLTLFPPAGPAAAHVRLPREIVFLVDTSGSMAGASLQQARKALALAIDRLDARDRFNVIRFSSTTEGLFDVARPASDEARARALEWVASLEASGGTEIEPALSRALTGGEDGGLVRQVVFLTDGCVSNEEPLFGLIHERLAATRLFTVGIGSAPNGHFMAKAAEYGRGSFTSIGDVREVEEKMARLFAMLESPVLTGIEVSWPMPAAVESWPQRLGDLYVDQPVVVSARFERHLADSVDVAGIRLGEPWHVRLALDAARTGEGVAAVWAQRKVRALTDSLHEGADADAVRADIVALGLEHHLVTPHTSLVAIDVTPARAEDVAPRTGRLPSELPAGWVFEEQWGSLPQTATEAPLRAAVAGVALLLAALIGAHRRPIRR